MTSESAKLVRDVTFDDIEDLVKHCFWDCFDFVKPRVGREYVINAMYVDDMPVSFLILERSPLRKDVWMLNLVGTRYGYGGRGYPKKLLSDHLLALRDITKLVTYVKACNVRSLNYHIACGFTSGDKGDVYGDFPEYCDERYMDDESPYVPLVREVVQDI